MSLENSLLDPAWFPDRIDAANRLIRLVRTDFPILRDSAFLDGRTPLTVDHSEAMILDLDRFVTEMTPAGATPALRWIFHASFCGSTLLARMTTITGRTLCLREPQILVDLANWRSKLGEQDRPLYQAVLKATRAKLGQRWHADEAILIKPSNWVNGIIMDLWQPQEGDHAIIADIDTEPFLVAVLRGGRDRIAYTLRVCERLTATWPALGERINAAISGEGDAMARAMQLTAATCWAQRLLFRARCTGAGTDLTRNGLLFPDFLDDRQETITRLADRLALPCTRDELAQSMEAALPFHSKQPGQQADAMAEAEANRQIRALHAPAIRSGLDLAQRLQADDAVVLAEITARMRAQDDAGAIIDLTVAPAQGGAKARP